MRPSKGESLFSFAPVIAHFKLTWQHGQNTVHSNTLFCASMHSHMQALNLSFIFLRITHDVWIIMKTRKTPFHFILLLLKLAVLFNLAHSQQASLFEIGQRMGTKVQHLSSGILENSAVCSKAFPSCPDPFPSFSRFCRRSKFSRSSKFLSILSRARRNL